MKIEYDKIIEAANKRKNDLMALQQVLAQGQHVIPELHRALEWLQTLQFTAQKIDDEGQKLLPPDLVSHIWHLGERARTLQNMNHDHENCIAAIREACQEGGQ